LAGDLDRKNFGPLNYLRAPESDLCQKASVISLRKLLSREDRLLTLLEASAVQAQECVEALAAECQSGGSVKAASDRAYSRHRDRNITREISDEVYAGCD
jgi:hypothetical protein